MAGASSEPGAGLTFDDYVGQVVVLDMRGPQLYIGCLESLSEQALLLRRVDVHDMHDSNSTKERYVLEARKHGPRVNRDRALVMRREVVSLSRLEDVIDY